MSGWKQRLLENKEQGAALVIAIVLLTAMELLGFALTTLSEIDYSVTGNMVKSECAAYAAEQGIYMSQTYINANKALFDSGGSIPPVCSSAYRDKDNSKTCGQDAYPNWTSTITRTGLGCNPGVPLPAGLKAFDYHIESVGTCSPGLSRTVVIEIGMFSSAYYNTRQYGRLAATVSGY